MLTKQSVIILTIICAIPVVVGFLIVKSVYQSLGKNKLTELANIFIGLSFFALILFAIGIYVGIIPLSIFGIEYQPTITTDEYGNPDCSPYQSPWGVVCE